MKMKDHNHELCRRISSNIYHLRNNLKELEKTEPSLFDGDNPEINSNWEFWTTDEILERISAEISDVLLTCKEDLQVVGNSDEVENEK
jgi:hypothetical protein